jgi:hypothetical protein
MAFVSLSKKTIQVIEFLKKWKIYYPEKCENNLIEFKLESFSFGFLGKLGKEYKTKSEIEINNSEFIKTFNHYQVIHPGLNYVISCENNACHENTDLMVFKKNYGTFRPNEDIEKMSCHICSSEIIRITSVILFQAEGIIEFRLDKTKISDSNQFEALGNQVIIFGDEDAFEEYAKVLIKVFQSSKPHKNTIAGITKDDLKNSKISENVRDTITHITPNQDFDYEEFDPSNADFKLIKAKVRIPLMQKITPVFEYIQSRVTDNDNICMSFKLNDSNQILENFVEFLDSKDKKNYCLFVQENDEPTPRNRPDIDDDDKIRLDQILNKWNVIFPENQESQNSVKFKLEKFYRAFLGIINYEIKNEKNEIILPFGFSYLVSCEEDDSLGIISRGYANFNPIIDIRFKTLRCPSCNNKSIENIKCIKMIILHQARGVITFNINGTIEEKKKKFETTENKLILLGDSFERFDQLIIETNPL